ncbi:MAG: PASTA domain-containing protein [Bacteroidetes bacterium]|jgi:beta-lactam-binding protein with PASTA domain|nr:PASTA domain-containing protein [Bacteroidota bacterium]MBK9524920.1 PASTA domain-containing protein [Bacteroidota bacterium]MBK9543090.1 PASTA domain-containing protein [Bacteroidota bacterium]MBL0257753.1 PASTA domain-containing protein [Bacteroidota bacterium]MBP6650123.1 PASTA domain-containing protein [Bacteroidia bacterium]
MLSNLIKFIRSRIFFVNLLAASVLMAAVFFGIYFWLGNFTHHGESITVPDLRGLKMAKLESFLTDKHLRFKVVDSLFQVDQSPGTVLEQDPAPDSKVKEERTIYLTVNSSQPPKVRMPNLIDVSYRQAEAILESFGLKVGQLIYRPDLARNAVLDQNYKGSSILPGKEIFKGSVIDLVLGDGMGNTEVPVPDLSGLTRGEALFVLKGSSLTIGTVHVDPGVRDSGSAKVYKQIPEASEEGMINQGEAVDIFIR